MRSSTSSTGAEAPDETDECEYRRREHEQQLEAAVDARERLTEPVASFRDVATYGDGARTRARRAGVGAVG
jgi:hypothetical protein